MPAQPPYSSMTQPQQPQRAASGLSRTRSLRQPQAGLPSSSVAAASALSHADKPAAGAAGRSASPSRLPVKPPLHLEAARAPTASTRPRPPSASGASSSSGSSLSARLRRPGSGASSATMTTTSVTTKPPSSSRTHLLSTAAPASTMRRPSSSGGLPSASTSSLLTAASSASRHHPAGASGALRGHTRTKSSSTATSASATALTPATVLRPPSAARPPSAQSSSAGSGSSSAANSRPPTRGASASTIAAAASAATASKGPAAVGTHRRPMSGSSSNSSATAAAAATHQRPAFSTLQQHYSPAKNLAPKPRIAAILAPPASPSKKPVNVARSVETSRLQTTLLQLHLLHRDAAAVTSAWHASARRALASERFSALVADHADLAQIAGQRAEAANAAALQQWAAAHGSDGGARDGSLDLLTLEEKIQTLDAVLAGVWSLAGHDLSATTDTLSSSSTSRYVHVVRRFERWAQHTAGLVAARQRVGQLDELTDDDGDSSSSEYGGDGEGRGSRDAAGAAFLSSDSKPLLGPAWHEECSALAHRLAGWQQKLIRLGQGIDNGGDSNGDDDGIKQPTALAIDRDGRPSLHRMLAGCRSLVDGMLEELRMMQQLARDAAEHERAWVQKMNASGFGSRAGSDDSVHGQPAARAGAIWRTI